MKEKEQKTNREISRRRFLELAATGAAAFTILPSHVISGMGHVTPSDKLRIAKVGCGGMGGADLGSLMTTPRKNAVITALCDVDDRQSADARKKYPKAPYYHDFRQMYDKERDNFDAVCISTPDHNHAIQALRAMEMGKHVYLQKPIAHDIHEARILTQAASKYGVVTQMGDQGNSCDGMRVMREWFDADLIGEIEKVYCWTNRPVWPQGIAWPKQTASVPKELDWDLWLGTAPHVDYVDNLLPFNWRGWWDYGTGALGDMGCHIIGPVFSLLHLEYPTEVSGSVASVYQDLFKEAYIPESAPVSSSLRYKFKKPNGKEMKLYWMDGGIMPERPEELLQDEDMGYALGDLDLSDFEAFILFVGKKGKVSCGWGGSDPRLILPGQPRQFAKDVNLPQRYARVEGGMEGHYWQWIDACIAGYGKGQVDSPFEGYGGPVTETVLMGNLLIRSYNIREKVQRKDVIYGDLGDVYTYPGRNLAFAWDGPNMRITNFEAANQFVKRQYREGWGELKL